MSSSTFTQRWTSANDLTTNSNNNRPFNPFFLQTQPESVLFSNSNTFTFTLRPSQSLASVAEVPLPPPSQLSANRPSSSRVADIIHRFESHSVSSMNNIHTKVSPPTRSAFTKQWEETRKNEDPSPRISSIAVIDTSSSFVPLTSKKNNKPQPIIVYERITNHDRPYKSLSSPPPSPLTKTFAEPTSISQQNIESDTDSAVHTMPTVISTEANDSTTLSRSSTSETTDSTCSSSSIPPPTPHFALPTIASAQKQRENISNSAYFKRTCSPPPSPTPVTTFTRTGRPISSVLNEDIEPSPLSTRFSSSEINLADQYRRLSFSDAVRSDSTLSQHPPTQILTIDTNLPLRYKRDSLIRLYG
jgi:hypothetical protein